MLLLLQKKKICCYFLFAFLFSVKNYCFAKDQNFIGRGRRKVQKNQMWNGLCNDLLPPSLKWFYSVTFGKKKKFLDNLPVNNCQQKENTSFIFFSFFVRLNKIYFSEYNAKFLRNLKETCQKKFKSKSTIIDHTLTSVGEAVCNRVAVPVYMLAFSNL